VIGGALIQSCAALNQAQREDDDGPGAVRPFSEGFGPVPGGVSSIASTDGLIAVAASDSTAILLLDTAGGSKIGELAAPTRSADDLAFSTGGKHLAAVSDDGMEIYVWDVGARGPARVVKRKTKVKGVGVFPGGDKVALGDEAGNLEIVDVASGSTDRVVVATGALAKLVEGDDKGVAALSISPSGKRLAAIAGGAVVLIADLEANDRIKMETVPKLRADSTVFSPDERFLLARAYNMSISIRFGSGGGNASVDVSNLAGGLLVRTGRSSSVTTARCSRAPRGRRTRPRLSSSAMRRPPITAWSRASTSTRARPSSRARAASPRRSSR
jgi:WD40 repeat protein